MSSMYFMVSSLSGMVAYGRTGRAVLDRRPGTGTIWRVAARPSPERRPLVAPSGPLHAETATLAGTRFSRLTARNASRNVKSTGRKCNAKAPPRHPRRKPRPSRGGPREHQPQRLAEDHRHAPDEQDRRLAAARRPPRHGPVPRDGPALLLRRDPRARLVSAAHGPHPERLRRGEPPRPQRAARRPRQRHDLRRAVRG